MSNKELPRGMFWTRDNTSIYLVRCPECKMENYAMNVSSGMCTWCGYNANDDPKYKNMENKDE
jgi:ribosomal protein L37E